MMIRPIEQVMAGPVTVTIVEQLAVQPKGSDTETVTTLLPSGKRLVKPTVAVIGGPLAGTRFVWTATPLTVQTTSNGSPAALVIFADKLATAPLGEVQPAVRGAVQVTMGWVCWTITSAEQLFEQPFVLMKVTTTILVPRGKVAVNEGPTLVPPGNRFV